MTSFVWFVVLMIASDRYYPVPFEWGSLIWTFVAVTVFTGVAPASSRWSGARAYLDIPSSVRSSSSSVWRRQWWALSGTVRSRKLSRYLGLR